MMWMIYLIAIFIILALFSFAVSFIVDGFIGIIKPLARFRMVQNEQTQA